MSETTKSSLDLLPNSYSFTNSWIEEKADRITRPEKIIPYGVTFLDDCFTGIAPDDLVVFGARSGAGKTQLCIQVAMNACLQNKKVLFFALESTKFEMSRRLKFAILYHELKNKSHYVGFNEWSNGLIQEEKDPPPQDWMNNLTMVQRIDNFGMDKLEKYILAQQLETDLIIIDHLHYLDLGNGPENLEVRDAVKAIRSISLEINKPIILVSHIRKRTQYQKQPWPDLDDFHGSSEISKMATQCFSLCQTEVDLISTIKTKQGYPLGVTTPIKGSVFTILKSRSDGSKVGEQALVGFDGQNRVYTKHYNLIKWDDSKERLTESHDVKPWAKHQIRKP